MRPDAWLRAVILSAKRIGFPPAARSRSLLLMVLAALCTVGATSVVGVASGKSGQGSNTPDYQALVRLPGHVHVRAQARFDVGAAPSSLPMGGLDLVFSRSAAQEKALNEFLAAQQDPKSPLYHHALTPAEYGRRFGASDATIAAVSKWLAASGFKVGTLPPGRGHLPFSGTEEQVEAAFHTQIHLFNVHGEQHFANVSDPQIPAAFQSLIKAIRGLHDFYPRPRVKQVSAAPQVNYPGNTSHFVGPTDFATIYNLLPLYSTGVTGSGVTVAIVGESDIDSSILPLFWSGFGITGASLQRFSSIPVPTSSGGVDPGQTSNDKEDEAYLDIEIVSSLAPGAQILFVRDRSASSAAQYVIDQNTQNQAAVLSISFGECEHAITPSEQQTIENMFKQATAQMLTVIVGSGDDGVSTCETSTSDKAALTGFAVNGLASTPYNLAVGGTEFDPNLEATYWSTSNQSGTLASALGHVPEMVWNQTCANPVLATLYGFNDAISFCNAGNVGYLLELSGGGGGLSSCTTVDSSGACTGGYPQPAWQANVPGIQNFGTRAVPDVSMVAHGWVICSYNNSSCNPASLQNVSIFDGTSASTPAVAAIVALFDQALNARAGLINQLLYSLAATEYSSSQLVSSCNASGGGASFGAGCVFYDVTVGNNDMPCLVSGYNSTGSLPSSVCSYYTGDTVGIVELSSSSGNNPAYPARSGFDLATGLGSINAANLVLAAQSLAAPTGLTASASGQTVTLSWGADSLASSFNIYQGTSAGQEAATAAQTGATGTSASVSGLQSGQTYFFKIAAVTQYGTSAYSNEAQATLAPAPPTGVAATASGTSATLNWTASSGASSYSVYQGTSAGAEGTTAVQTGVTGTSATISGLTNGQTYYFTVVAVDAGGPSSASNEASAVIPPAAPTSLTASAGDASVSLSWSAGTGSASYSVFQGTTAGGEAATAVQTGITGTTATISGLANGQAYYFTVKGVDSGGNSPASNEASATPSAPGGGGHGGGMSGLELAVLAMVILWGYARRTPIARTTSGTKPSSVLSG